MMGKRRLHRGLNSLLGGGEDETGAEEADVSTSGPPTTASDPPRVVVAEAVGEFVSLPLGAIDSNPFQPRREFAANELKEMADSITAHGVLMPIVVRAVEGGRYQLIAGERRLRATQVAGLTEIPARIQALDDRQTFEVALVENLQRRDLNAIEKARAFEEYLRRFDTTHEELASHLGVDRSTVTNLIRLLDLPEPVRESVRDGQLSNGHARALLSLDDPLEQITLARRTVEEALSVRQVEALVREYKQTAAQLEAEANGETASEGMPATVPLPAKGKVKSTHLLSLETNLCQTLGTKVEIKPKAKDRGIITIHFDSHEDFERLLAYLAGTKAAAAA